MNAVLAFAATETLCGQGFSETIGANFGGLNADCTFLAKKNDTPFAVHVMKSLLTIGGVDSKSTTVALGHIGKVPGFLQGRSRAVRKRGTKASAAAST